jgi:hypothetical protein
MKTIYHQGDYRMTRRNRLIAACLMTMTVSIVTAADSAWQGPPMVGRFEAYHKAQPANKQTGKIYINRDGMRNEMAMPGGNNITIQNMKAGKCWYVDDVKKIYTESPINKKTGDCPPFMGEAVDVNLDKSTTADEQCQGYTKKVSLGSATVAGRAAEKWSCTGGQGGASATQWHDRKYKLMLKEEMSDGDVMEFRELSETSFASSLLEMPKGTKRVSAEEFRKAMFGGMLPPGMPAK